MRRGGAGFGGSVAISAVATVLLLVAITGARRPAHLAGRGAPPWPVPSSPGMGVRAAGLSLQPEPGVVTRYAVHLDVLVDGKAVRVPPGIGIDWHDHTVAALYTDDGSGIIHVSSDEPAPVFTLGQFFDEWQVPLGSATAYVNGQPSGGDPAAVVLAPHQEIAVSYGARLVQRVPRVYAFPAGT
jgi:hypothetical protein